MSFYFASKSLNKRKNNNKGMKNEKKKKISEQNRGEGAREKKVKKRLQGHPVGSISFFLRFYRIYTYTVAKSKSGKKKGKEKKVRKMRLTCVVRREKRAAVAILQPKLPPLMGLEKSRLVLRFEAAEKMADVFPPTTPRERKSHTTAGSWQTSSSFFFSSRGR